MIKKIGLLGFINIVVLSCILTGTAYSQSTEEYHGSWALNGGGSTTSSGTYTNTYSLGEPVIETTLDNQYANTPGIYPYEVPRYALTIIAKGEGMGSITVNNVEWAYGHIIVFDESTPVTLVAKKGENSIFDSWSVGKCGSIATCNITVASYVTLEVTFNTVDDPGAGGGSGSEPNPVPEPATILLFIAGLLGLLGLGVKRRRKR